jgi:hypothetical protein
MTGRRRTDRNGCDAAGAWNAECEQNRLQSDRIGRCQRYPDTRVPPQIHRQTHGSNLVHFKRRWNGRIYECGTCNFVRDYPHWRHEFFT